MAPKLTGNRTRDKIMKFLHLRPRAPQSTESSIDIPATQPPTTPLPPPQLAGNIEPPVLNPHDIEPTSTKREKVFTKGKSFKKDMAILSIAYTLQKNSELKSLIQLIIVIRNNDSEGQLTEVLETCARFSVQLASATDAQHAEATQAITSFNETVAKLNTIQLNGDGKSLDELMIMINEDIKRIKLSFINDGELGTAEKLSKVLDITIGTTISILSLVQEASSLIPVPWVHPLIGKVVSMLQAVSQTRSNYNEMNQVAATAGEFVLSCAVICSESRIGPSDKLKRSLNELTKTLESIAKECDKLSRLNPLSRYLQQNAHMGDLQATRIRLNAAIQLFQTENGVNIKLDTEELNRKFDFASLNDLPSHPDYTPNDYLKNSRDDVIRYVSDWIANASESVLWIHGAAGLGKSTVGQELVQLLKSEDRLAGGVFLTNLTTEPPKKVIQMISRQLGTMYPQAIANIANAARRLNGPHDRLEDYFTAYLFDPIRALGYPYHLVVVVDGLEEWRNYESFLAELVDISSPFPLKIVLTSRFNYSIERAVDKMPSHKYPLPPASQTVIERYFHQHFLSGNINWRGRKPDDEKIRRLATRADGLLIWAATARLLVTNKFDSRYPHEIVDQLLSSEEVLNQKDSPEDGQLERLYRGAISSSFPPHIRGILRKFLAATLVLQEALSIGDFAHLSGIPEPATEEIHQRLAALQTQGDPKTNLVSPATQRFHASFVEFITTKSDDQTFPAINTTEAHNELANRCLKIVFDELLQSIRGKTCTYTELWGVEKYAVKFWPLHFSSGTPRLQLAPLSGTAVGMDLISEDAMRRWATLFLPSIAARFQDGHNSLHGLQKSRLPYEVAVMIGRGDATTLSYHIQCLEIAIRLQPLDMGTWKAIGFAYQRLHEQSQSNRDLDEKITAFRHGLEPAPHPRRANSLNDIAAALHTRYKQRGASNDLDEAISLLRETLLLRPAPHPNHSISLGNLATVLHTRFKQQGASNDLDEAISLHQEALLLMPAPHPGRSSSLCSLAQAIQTRFMRWGASNDLDEAIVLHQEALLLQPAPHPDRSMSLDNLATALQTRCEQRGASNDFDEAISLHQEALLLRPAPHPDRSMSLNNLACALLTRFQQLGTSNDLNEAISLHRETLLLHPARHPDRSTSLNNLAYALQTRFKWWGASNDFDEAISLHQEALLLRPAPHPNRTLSLNNIAIALRIRFQHQGTSKDLDKAIFFHREALLLQPAPQSDYFNSLGNLAAALHTRFDQQGASNDLDEAISLYREALLRPAPHPLCSSSLIRLANALQTRFERRGASSDLDEAISLHQEALLLQPAPHPDRSTSLNNLAYALETRFEQQGASNDLDEAISLLREALFLCPAHHPDCSMSLNALAITLQTRFEQRGASNDLDEAVSLHREALLLLPTPHPDRSASLNYLANALQTYFEQRGALIDLDEAISLHREALLLQPAPHPDRSTSLNNLAYALKTRFEQQGASNDLDEAISLLREALFLCPAHHPLHSNLLIYLSIALRTRFDKGNLLHDIIEVISLYERLLDCPSHDPNRSWSLKHLPAALRERRALIGSDVTARLGLEAVALAWLSRARA